MTKDEESKVADIIKDMATHIESLQRENEELKNLIDGDNCADPDKIDALFRRAEAAEAEVKRYRVALIAAKTRMRNCRGAIESNQVVDKDVHGSLQNGIRDIQEALASTGGEHNGN
ncbi:MAG: hypothetical protein [Bacteriophage sp.]|nr:MAG: hypothetical protein [Bacteriophage sp.]